MIELNEKVALYKPEVVSFSANGSRVFLDPQKPNWIVTDARGETILSWVDGKSSFTELVNRYARHFQMDHAKAWLHVHTFVQDALRTEFLQWSWVGDNRVDPDFGQRTTPGLGSTTLKILGAPTVSSGTGSLNGVMSTVLDTPSYPGRNGLVPISLTELWLHTNNSCNLMCSHCLVDSSPSGERGLPTQTLKKIIHEALALGVRRFYFTGGEPFIRQDLFELMDAVVKHAELIILTNGMLLEGSISERLSHYDSRRLKLQISLDGTTPEKNDPIRGGGTFEKILQGIRNAVELGLLTSVTTAITQTNLDDLPNFPGLLAQLGVRNHHLLWPHKRGRALEGDDYAVTIPKLIESLKKLKETARQSNITVDNFEEFVGRVNDLRGIKKDLSGAGVNSLCVYADGSVYPSPAFAHIPELKCGSIPDQSLEEILLESSITKQLQAVSLQEKPICPTCPWKFICGGGDIEHAYFYSDAKTVPERLRGHDPYCEVYQYLLQEAVEEVAKEKGKYQVDRSGFNAPTVLHGMGEESIVVGFSQNGYDTKALPSVQTVHSNCVLTFDLDHSRQAVRTFYGKAAEEPQKELCCPVNAYAEADLAHIPQEVIDRFYGCGGPMTIAGVQPGERVLDLGSGGGIDCFIAAKQVGPMGKVYGVDMTEEMLKVAKENSHIVTERLGYDVVEFKQGFLEEIPLSDQSVDLVTSNCVMNLSPDKRAVFKEMWRVLADHGRIVLSDVVSEQETPPYLKINEALWGECISGALTEEKLITYLEQAGFYGLQVLKKSFWKEAEGYRFYSIIVKGYKFEKKAGCNFIGQKAVYLGPLKSIMDEEGHLFPRNVPIEVCTDTAAKLSHPPYQNMFSILEPGQKATGVSQHGCDPTTGCC